MNAAGLPWWLVLAGAILGSGGLGAVAVKLLSRRGDAASTAHTLAQADRTRAETELARVQAGTQALDQATSVAGLVRGELDRVNSELLAVRAAMEAHGRAARRHETWDRQAAAALRKIDPDFPDPPSLWPDATA